MTVKRVKEAVAQDALRTLRGHTTPSARTVTPGKLFDGLLQSDQDYYPESLDS